MNVKEIAKISKNDIRKLTTKEARELVTKMVSAMNKIIKRSKPTESGAYSPAIMQLARQQGIDLSSGEKPRLSVFHPDLPAGASPTQVANATRQGLQQQLARLQEIYNSKTFKAKKFKEFRKELESKLPKEVTKSPDKEKEFWQAYNDFMYGKNGDVRNLKEIFNYRKGERGVVLEYAELYAQTHPNFNKNTLYNALMKEYENRGKAVDEQFKTFKFKGKTLSFDDLVKEDHLQRKDFR